MLSEQVIPSTLSAARTALLAATANTEVVVLDALQTSQVSGSMLAAFVGAATLGVYADQPLTFYFRKRAAGGSYRDAPDDDGSTPTAVPAGQFKSIRTTWDALDHRLVLKTGATPPSIVELTGRVYVHGQHNGETGIVSGILDCTVGGATQILRASKAGKSWKMAWLEIEIVSSNINGMTAASVVTIGANAPAFDNLDTFSLTGCPPRQRYHFGQAYSAIDVGTHDLVALVASPQVGGALSVKFRMDGLYV
jgi:hypothetical protein